MEVFVSGIAMHKYVHYIHMHSLTTQIIVWPNACGHLTITHICGPYPHCCHEGRGTQLSRMSLYAVTFKFPSKTKCVPACKWGLRLEWKKKF